MKTKHALALIFALVALGATLILGTEPIALAMAIPDLGTELSKFYTEFYDSWTYVPDGENIWSIVPNHRGDCEDFALTFYSEYPSEISAWVLVVRTRSSFLERILGTPKYRGHALLVIWEEFGFYVVDNGNVVYLEGPFASYDEAMAFYVEASGAISAWSLYLPPKDGFPAEEDSHFCYLEERYQFLP